MQIGNWQIDTVAAGQFWHDGGVIYGIVPKSVWQSVTPADERNRVLLAMTCLLARNGEHTVLIDAGAGEKLSPLDRASHGLVPARSLSESMLALGVAACDVDAVVLTHLHWDHAGGATTRDAHGRLITAFPNATYLVHRDEWQDANGGGFELSGGYVADDYRPIELAGQLRLVADEHVVLPGISMIRTGGHTRGHAAVVIESAGEGAVFMGDICPTLAHTRRLWCTAYDLDLAQTRRAKVDLLGRAADRGHWVIYDHDATTVASKVRRHAKREFETFEPRGDL